VDDHCFDFGGNMVLPVNITGCIQATPPAQPVAAATVKVNWVYSSKPYAAVSLKCGDVLNLSWARSAHNVLLDTQGGLAAVLGPRARAASAADVAFGAGAAMCIAAGAGVLGGRGCKVVCLAGPGVPPCQGGTKRPWTLTPAPPTPRPRLLRSQLRHLWQPAGGCQHFWELQLDGAGGPD
jgi:hypothetical protein